MATEDKGDYNSKKHEAPQNHTEGGRETQEKALFLRIRATSKKPSLPVAWQYLRKEVTRYCQ